MIRTWVTADQVPPQAGNGVPLGRCWQRLVDGYGAELGWVDRSQLRRPDCVRELTGGVGCVTVPQVHRVGEQDRGRRR